MFGSTPVDGFGSDGRTSLARFVSAFADRPLLTGRSIVGGPWAVTETPTHAALTGVVRAGDTAVAVGADGTAFERSSGEWTALPDDGALGDARPLVAAGATDDGEAVWLVGESGRIAEYVPRFDVVIDHSVPTDARERVTDVAVSGAAGDADVYATGGDGSLWYGPDNADAWRRTTPGTGAALTAVDLRENRAGSAGDAAGYAVDRAGSVFAIDGTDATRIGIDGADATLRAVDGRADAVRVGADDGRVFERRDDRWTVRTLGDGDVIGVDGDGDVIGVDADGESGYAVTAAGGVYDLRTGDRLRTPAGVQFHDLVVGERTLLVGSDGTVLERVER